MFGKKKDDLEMWKEERGYNMSYEEEQRKEQKKELFRKVLTIGLAVAILAVSLVTIQVKKERDYSAAIAEQKAKNRMGEEIVKEDKEVEALVEVEPESSSKNPEPDFNPEPNPKPNPKPNPNPDSKPLPPTPTPDSNPSPKDPSMDYHNDPMDDSVCHDNASVGGGHSILTVEDAEREVRRAEAQLMIAKIALYEAEHPDMSEEEYEEYGRMVGELGEKVDEVLNQ